MKGDPENLGVRPVRETEVALPPPLKCPRCTATDLYEQLIFDPDTRHMRCGNCTLLFKVPRVETDSPAQDVEDRTAEELLDCAVWLEESARLERGVAAQWVTAGRKSPHNIIAAERFERWAASLRLLLQGNGVSEIKSSVNQEIKE